MRSLRSRLRAVGLAVLLVAYVELVLLSQSESYPFWLLSLFVVQGLLWAGTGLIAWSRRPSNRTGLLLVAGGAAFFGAALGNTQARPLAAVGVLVGSLPLALAVHVLLAFPSGRTQGRPARLVVVAGYVIGLSAPLPVSLFVAGSPIALDDVPAIARLSEPLEAMGRLLTLVVVVLLLDRLRISPPAQRRSLGPLYAYGAVSTLGITFAAQLQELVGITDATRFVLQSAALAVIPVAFTAVLLRGGFARAGEVEELSSLLSTEQTPTQEVLARVLGDPSLELLHWLPIERTWVDGDGRPRTPPSDVRRGLVEVTIAGRRAGALTYDAVLLPDPDLVRLAARPAGLALEAERLTVELRRSRARLVAAADDERRRLARDLHDGLQVRLVLLAMEAGTASATARDPASVEALQSLRHGVDEAAAELRRTVHSLLPAALVERGLGPAVEDLVDRLPLPTRLVLEQVPSDLTTDVVTTAWYVVTEGLTNALRHAGASSLCVEVRARQGCLLVTVGDDGSGGASLRQGSGLRGLVDRLDLVGGRLHLDSPAGGGTSLRAEIPWPA